MQKSSEIWNIDAHYKPTIAQGPKMEEFEEEFKIYTRTIDDILLLCKIIRICSWMRVTPHTMCSMISSLNTYTATREHNKYYPNSTMHPQSQSAGNNCSNYNRRPRSDDVCSTRTRSNSTTEHIPSKLYRTSCTTSNHIRGTDTS